jgi:hypothetical protein
MPDLGVPRERMPVRPRPGRALRPQACSNNTTLWSVSFQAPCFPCSNPTDYWSTPMGNIPRSPRCSTSNPYYSSSSCSSVPARTFAPSRRGSLTVTSKGAWAIFLRNPCMCSSSVDTPVCSPTLPYFPHTVRGLFCRSPDSRSDANGLLQLPWHLFHVRPNWCVPISFPNTPGATDRAYALCAHRGTAIALCGVSVHRNGRTNHTFMTSSLRISVFRHRTAGLAPYHRILRVLSPPPELSFSSITFVLYHSLIPNGSCVCVYPPKREHRCWRFTIEQCPGRQESHSIHTVLVRLLSHYHVLSVVQVLVRVNYSMNLLIRSSHVWAHD